jgi:hypothetical protein
MITYTHLQLNNVKKCNIVFFCYLSPRRNHLSAMRNRQFINVRIDKSLANKAQIAADSLGPGISRNFIIEESARAVLDMIDNNKARVLPKIVRIIDEARAADSKPTPLKKRSSSSKPRLPSGSEMANQLTRQAGRSASKQSPKKA